jgi:dTDP-glucose 4,6-dehydratase
MAALQHGRPGQTYLFGGRCEVQNLKLAGIICALLDVRRPRAEGQSYAHQITLVSDRPGHDWRYAIDPSHAEAMLGWKAVELLDSGLAKTIDWYLANTDCLIPVNALGRLGTRTIEHAKAAP